MYDEPTVLLAKRVSGEEEVPEGVVAVLTPDAPDVLSHVSVRARNMKVQMSPKCPLLSKTPMVDWLGYSELQLIDTTQNFVCGRIRAYATAHDMSSYSLADEGLITDMSNLMRFLTPGVQVV